jgi:hypothetical protein
MEAAMGRDKQIELLRSEIAEVEELIQKWQNTEDSETRCAVELLEQCLVRRKHVLAVLSFQMGGDSGCQSGKRY